MNGEISPVKGLSTIRKGRVARASNERIRRKRNVTPASEIHMHRYEQGLPEFPVPGFCEMDLPAIATPGNANGFCQWRGNRLRCNPAYHDVRKPHV